MSFRPTVFATAASLLLSVALQATPVTYRTEGSFNGTDFAQNISSDYIPCGTATACDSGASGTRLSYHGANEATVDSTTFGSLGLFMLESLTASPATNSLNGLQFWLRVIQTSPTGGQDTVMGTAAGTVNSTSANGAHVTFNDGTLTVGSVTYSIANGSFNLTNTIALVPPSVINFAGAGVSTIEARIETAGSAVPEPSTYLLLGSGLAGLIAFRRRATR